MKTAFLFLIFVFTIVFSFSQIPSPLPGFGVNGKMTTSFPGHSSASCYSMAIQADHKIVLTGIAYSGSQYDVAVARYNTDGTLDNSFDGDGRLIIDLGVNSLDDGQAVKIQPDGKIVILGTTSINNATSGYDLLLVRLNPDGTLDNSFDGDGILVKDYGGTSQFARDMLIQPDGKIVVAAHHKMTNPTNYDFLIMRFNPDGSTDNSFNGDGKRLTDFGGYENPTEMALQADGKIVLVGYQWNVPLERFIAARYNPDGTLDNDFDLDGKFTTSFVSTNTERAWAVAIQPDQKILIGGLTGDGTNFLSALVRINTNGSIDSTFNETGRVLTSTGISAAGLGIDAITVQNDNKIIVAGWGVPAADDGDFLLVRYQPNGVVDSSFDDDGIALVNVGSDDGGYDIKLDGSAIYVAGYSDVNDPVNHNNEMALVALTNDAGPAPVVFNASLCIGTDTTLTAAVTNGTVFQWQVNTGSGFVNISNDGNYSGTNTASLQLTGLPSGWYSFQYRCVVDGNNGYAYSIRFRNSWTGAVNTAWENPGNWSCGIVPDSNTDVIIAGGIILISSNVTIHTLAMSSGVNLTVSSGNNLTILH